MIKLHETIQQNLAWSVDSTLARAGSTILLKPRPLGKPASRNWLTQHLRTLRLNT